MEPEAPPKTPPDYITQFTQAQSIEQAKKIMDEGTAREHLYLTDMAAGSFECDLCVPDLEKDFRAKCSFDVVDLLQSHEKVLTPNIVTIHEKMMAFTVLTTHSNEKIAAFLKQATELRNSDQNAIPSATMVFKGDGRALEVAKIEVKRTLKRKVMGFMSAGDWVKVDAWTCQMLLLY